MTPEEFRDIRFAIGVGVVAFGRALGYRGGANGVSRQVRRLEEGGRPIMPNVAARARELLSLFERGELDHLRDDGTPRGRRAAR
jgi:hypothetical protein